MELIVVLVIALVVLGPKRLPDAGKSIGKGMREFKDAISGDSNSGPVDAKGFEQASVPAAPVAVAQTAPAPQPVAPVAHAEQQPTA